MGFDLPLRVFDKLLVLDKEAIQNLHYTFRCFIYNIDTSTYSFSHLVYLYSITIQIYYFNLLIQGNSRIFSGVCIFS